jgi:hypothetical protein
MQLRQVLGRCEVLLYYPKVFGRLLEQGYEARYNQFFEVYAEARKDMARENALRLALRRLNISL